MLANKFFFLLLFGLAVFSFSCDSQPYKQGKALYTIHCSNCHMEDGTGLAALIPPLAGSDYLKNNIEKVPCIIRNGLEEEITVNGKQYKNPMAGIENLTPFEISNIINYINHAWGNDFGFVKINDIKERLQNCEQ